MHRQWTGWSKPWLNVVMPPKSRRPHGAGANQPLRDLADQQRRARAGLVKSVGAANFGLLLDTFHMNIEEPQINQSIEMCAERIFHFHVADSNRWYPGAGHLDFDSILKTLAATGYQGYVSGEFLPKPDANTAAKKSIDYLNTLD